MRRKLIVMLVAVAGAIALAAAALAWPSPPWAGIVLTGTVAVLAVATLGAVRRRAFCIGFAVFSWLYLLLVATSSLSQCQPVLPTTQAVAWLKTPSKPSPADDASARIASQQYQLAVRVYAAEIALTHRATIVAGETLASIPRTMRVEVPRLAGSSNRPPTEPIFIIGQALWTIVLGLVGGAAACVIRAADRWMASRGAEGFMEGAITRKNESHARSPQTVTRQSAASRGA
jgi:hypothetical protein